MKTLTKKLLPAVAMAVTLLASAQAGAATFYLDRYLTGSNGTENSTSKSAATYTVDQRVGTNIVDFSLASTISNIDYYAAGGYIGYFEFISKEAEILESDISITNGSATTVTIDKIDLIGGTKDGFKDAGYLYQVKFGFENGNSGNRFLDGETIGWSIADALATNFTSLDSHFESDNPLAAVHVQGLENGYSVKYGVSAVPVPAAVWLFGSALLGLTGVTRRKKTNTAVVEA